MNMLRTILLMGILTAIIVLIGGFVGGKGGLVMAFGFALLTNFTAYWFSDKLALAMSGAQPVSAEEAPELYEIVARLAKQMNLPLPAIHIIPSPSPNAFATGRDPEHSSVAVTAGILKLLTKDEIEAVLAHELGHVRNRDVLITTMAAVLASVVTFVAHWGFYLGGSDDREGGVNPLFMVLLIILAPIAASLINLAISRAREYDADATGAKMCGKPLQLASALAKIEAASQAVPFREANPALSSLYIVKPDPQSWFVNLLSTHPPTQERIKRLKEMALLSPRL